VPSESPILHPFVAVSWQTEEASVPMPEYFFLERMQIGTGFNDTLEPSSAVASLPAARPKKWF